MSTKMDSTPVKIQIIYTGVQIIRTNEQRCLTFQHVTTPSNDSPSTDARSRNTSVMDGARSGPGWRAGLSESMVNEPCEGDLVYAENVAIPFHFLFIIWFTSNHAREREP